MPCTSTGNVMRMASDSSLVSAFTVMAAWPSLTTLTRQSTRTWPFSGTFTSTVAG